MTDISRSDITAGFKYGVNILNDAARRAISKSDDFINRILGTRIDERVDFNDMNYNFMLNLMKVNINEHDLTLASLGSGAMDDGDSTKVTGQAQNYSYADPINYRTNYVNGLDANEHNGVNTTRTSSSRNSFYRDPYRKITNLFPDELKKEDKDRWHFSNHWNLDGNRNSILYKTKQLFNGKKINTIISKFGTAVDDGMHLVGVGDAVVDQSGMSHGRNLLTASAEKGGDVYAINGYNNPYCRVWTHHYQYDRLDKLIRPFVIRNGENSEEVVRLSDMHDWGSAFKTNEVSSYWKKGDVGWDKSVLDDNGFVKIAPKYQGGGANNVHTKDCMFSIENLAWRGYDPYSFEKALSWEQRGPLGGRIMWFPPYGLSFNETTQANWSSNTFIGRGEDVYTYVNTVRSGTLSFIMLTDHPSVVDYANWYDSKAQGQGAEDLTDTDLLRFFAGCDSMNPNDSNSILSKVKPTPLTDEYTNKPSQKEIIQNLSPNPKPEPVPEPEKPKDLIFYAFYPNNYSGIYDMPSNKESNVHSIAYLLKGKGAQKENGGSENDVPITFDDLSTDISAGRTGNGYEMNGKGITDKDYIIGSGPKWNEYKRKTYVKSNPEREWFYRIDGKYEVAKGATEINRNTYDQRLYDTNKKVTIKNNSNYKDTENFQYNKSAEAVKNSGFVTDTDGNIYSLLEVAAALAKRSGKSETYNVLISECEDGKRVDEIIDILDKYKISNIDITGYSNSHGYNSSKNVNNKRNKLLARQRATTLWNWLDECGLTTSEGNQLPISIHTTSVPNDSVKKGDEYNISAPSAKLRRSAMVKITFDTSTTDNLTDTNEGNGVEYQKYNGLTPLDDKSKKEYISTLSDKGDFKGDCYKDKDGNIWMEDSEGVLKRYETQHNINERNTLKLENVRNEYGRRLLYYSNNNTDAQDSMNDIRYDQEYYFFKRMEKDNPIVFEKLTEKLKYFDPAFHSMTPEGFNERLTFLNQCTRQGNTVSNADHNGKTASNLAFGRPPFCVLRIGDFYYQTIVIDSINIDYGVSGGLQWDLNPEGVGVQPMLAQINISFKFIGGGDLGGPIRRLQNAMTFNYYANARLYDNRADRIGYHWSDRTNGASDYDVDSEKSSAYITKMADKN